MRYHDNSESAVTATFYWPSSCKTLKQHSNEGLSHSHFEFLGLRAHIQLPFTKNVVTQREYGKATLGSNPAPSTMEYKALPLGAQQSQLVKVIKLLKCTKTRVR